MARAAARKLGVGKSEDFISNVDAVGTHVSAAQQTFRDIAREASYTLLIDQNLRTVPVSGQQPGDIDRDLGDPPKPQTTPPMPPMPPPDTTTTDEKKAPPPPQ